MAGGNKSNSPKTKKRKLQEEAQARKQAEEKKKRFTRGSPS